MTTTEKLEYVIENWNKVDFDDMVKKLGVNQPAISQWACKLRKLGIETSDSKIKTIGVDLAIWELRQLAGKDLI